VELKFDVQKDCPVCKTGLARMRALLKKHPAYYGTHNVNDGACIKGLVIRPDYNSFGNPTGWHIEPEA
jgi:hypothetical protein